MMLMIIKIVSGDSKLHKGGTRQWAAAGIRRGGRRLVLCSGDVLIADRRWGHRRYTRITRTRNGLPEGACPTPEVTVRKAVEAGTMHWE